MVEYTPPPPTLDHLNAVQRYMQKGHLDKQDYINLAIGVLVYFMIRPYLQKGAKWLFSSDQIKEGEQEQKEYQKRRAKAKITANSIRGLEHTSNMDVTEDITDDDAVTSGTNVGSHGGVPVNRKNKPQSGSKKTEQDKLLDWDDEPARASQEDGQSDVMAWLDKWDK